MMACCMVWITWFFLQLFLFTLEVQCMDLRISDVRLRRIFHPRGGIVEVNFQIAKDTWKPVCAPPGSEGKHFADLVCSHLGFGGVSKMPERAPQNATYIYKRPISMSCTANGLLENCTSKLHFGNCEKLAYIECDYEPMKCIDRCGKPSNSYACGCDAYCVTVGDCCHDFTEICPQEHDVSVRRLTSTEKEAYQMYEICFQVFNEKTPRPTITQPTKYRMVANCPSTWTNHKVVSECEANVTFSNFLSIFPVHNEVGILFKNSYCALCHGTAVEDMLPWILESDGSKRWVAPPRNIWGSQFNVCNEGFNFFKSCPPGTNKTISEKCDSYLKPQISYDGVIKNEHCGFCNGQIIAGAHTIKQPVTFDVIFGLKSWSALTASCGSSSHIDVSGLFQNACPLLNDLIQLEKDESETTDTSPEQCVRDFMSKTFQISEIFYHLNLTMVTAESEFYISAIGLPNELTILHLENSLRNRLTIPNCNLIMSVFLPSSYRCDGVDELDVEEQPFDNKVMTFQCKQATCKVTTFYEDVCFENLTCRWEHEYLSPIDFKVEDFVAMEMTHVQTGAVLTRKDFMITIDQQIHTCSEVLIGPWIRTAYFIQMICGPLSLICIILMIMIHILFSKLRNIYGFCIVSLLAMLFVSLVLFMLSTLSQMVDGLAQFVVAISHYAWLSAFAWMTVISFHVSHTFGSKFVANRMSRISNRKEVLLYSLFGWGIPLPFLLIGISLHLCDCTTFHYTTHWMSRGVPTVMLFALPAGVLALTTTILFINGIAKLRRRQATPQESETSRLSHMHNYIVALRLCFIVGIPWVLFIIYVANRNRYLLPILTLVNSLQGCFIFISFVTTRRVRALITEKLTVSQLATTTTYSKGKHSAQTETGTPETTPRLKRGKLPGSSSPSDQHRAVD